MVSKSSGYLKHINILTSSHSSATTYFSNKLQLPELWTKSTENGTHTAFVCGPTHFVISEPRESKKSHHDKGFIFSDLYNIQTNTGGNQYDQLSYGRLNSAVNLTICVDKLRFDTLQSTVKNRCSLVTHMPGDDYRTNLISTPLPGFSHLFLHQDENSIISKMFSPSYYGLDSTLFSGVDHMLCAVDENGFDPAMKFYTEELGFERFQVSPKDEVELGLRVEANPGDGLVMKTMNFSENSEAEMRDQSLKTKIMLAHSLNPNGSDNLRTFISNNANHGGCHHIALQAKNIFAACETLRSNGIEFVEIPKIYYKDRNWRYDIQSMGLSPDSLEANGILCDWEQSSARSSAAAKDGKPSNYILQIFTKPIFGKGIFLEIIERAGTARGFGENNIKSLWNAVEKNSGRGVYNSN